MILPDTSVWIDFLGRKARPQSRWLAEQISLQKRVFMCAPVLQEVLQGTRSEQAFGRARRQLEPLPWAMIEDPTLHAILAARLYAQLRWRGHTIRSSNDCLIASIAAEHDLLLLHDDRDFELIASVEPRLRLAERSL